MAGPIRIMDPEANNGGLFGLADKEPILCIPLGLCAPRFAIDVLEEMELRSSER